MSWLTENLIANRTIAELIDVNVYHGRWPFRSLQLDAPELLADALTRRGVRQAWVGSLDAILHRDMATVNERTAATCQRFADQGWRAVGCVNPTLPDWEDDLRRCHQQHGMFAIRLHPNYHGYRLEDAKGRKLLELASDLGLLVQIAISMEDERTQHPLMQVPKTDPKPLMGLLEDLPQLRVMLLNLFHGFRADLAGSLAKPSRVWFDIATLEGVEGVAKLVAATDADSVVYGSYQPLFYLDAAYFKLIESGLPDSTLARIASTNASQF